MSAEGGVIVRRGYTEGRFGQIHYLEGRPTTPRDRIDPVLVLLHQNPSSSLEYEPLVRELGRDRRVIAFDTPGYGMSAPPPEPLSVAGYAAAFSDAIDAMGLTEWGPVDVFGYHSGTLLAAELGLMRPDAVGRLIMSGVPMRSPEECAERLAAARASPQPTEDGEALLKQSAALWRYVVTSRNPAVPLDRAAVLFADKGHALHRAWWVYEGVWSYPTRERFPLIPQPVLFLQPDDGLFDVTLEACGLVANGVFVDLRPLDRDIFEIASRQIAKAIIDFLSPPSLEESRPLQERVK